MRSQGFSHRARLGLAGRVLLAGALVGLLGACQESRTTTSRRAHAPIPSNVLALMKEKGTDAHRPILIRAFKKEAELEIWKQKPTKML